MTNDYQRADTEEAYRVLELTSGATLDEIKQAYRDLAQIWHPDRFTQSTRLQQKALERMKQINVAYKFLTTQLAQEPLRPTVSESELALTAMIHALGQILTRGGTGNFAIANADPFRNYYAQFAAQCGGSWVYGEVVSNEFLSPQYALNALQVQRLQQLGWAVKPGQNYSKEWFCGTQGVTKHIIAGEVVNVLCQIYGIHFTQPLVVEINLE